MYTIKRKYHFYAAHRNESVNDKCKNLHGHTYKVCAYFDFNAPGKNGVTMLFSDIDKLVEPIIKRLDHSLLINHTDPIFDVLKGFDIKINAFLSETSCENLAAYLYEQIGLAGLPIQIIDLSETESSSIIYQP